MSPWISWLWQSEQRSGWKTYYDLDYKGLIPDNCIDMILLQQFYMKLSLLQPQNKSGNFSEVMLEKPIQEAARSKVWVCGRWLPGIAVSNPAGSIVISLLWLFCFGVEICASSWSLVQRSPTKCGVSECDLETSRMRRIRPTRTVVPWKCVSEHLNISEFTWTNLHSSARQAVTESYYCYPKYLSRYFIVSFQWRSPPLGAG
jgi:hypothetical protein